MFKLFNRWDTASISISDPGLKDYINIPPTLVPKTPGRNAKQQFYKARYHIVERLTNHLMVPGHKSDKHYITSGYCGGKGITASNIIYKSFSHIEKQTNQNPVTLLVKAVENAAPREEITTIEYGGACYPQAVDCSPLRRIDFALRMLVQGAFHSCFGKKTKMFEALADEIIKAATADMKSHALQRKIELEKQAEAAR